MDAKEYINNRVQESIKNRTYMKISMSHTCAKESPWLWSEMEKAIEKGELDMPIEWLRINEIKNGRGTIRFYPRKDIIGKMIEILDTPVDWESSPGLRNITIQEFERKMSCRKAIVDYLKMIDIDKLNL